MNQVVTELVIDGRGAETGSAAYVRAMQVAQAAVDRLRDREEALKTASDASAARMLSSSTSTQRAANAYDRLKASMDPVFAASKGLERDLATLDRAVTRLGVSEAEAARMLDLITTKHNAAAAAARSRAQAETALAHDANANFRRTNLGYQGFDIAQGLMAGAPLTMIAAQQGPQIAQAYMGQGGVKALSGDLKAMTVGAGQAVAAVAAMVPVWGWVAAGVATAGAAAGAYYLSTKEKAKELNEILSEQKDIVQSLAPAYQELARAGQGPFENISVARLALQSNLDDARKLLKDQQQSAIKEARGTGGTFLSLFGMLPEGAQSMLGRSQASLEFDRIVDSAAKGEISINDARTALAHFGQEHPDFSYVIGRFITMTDTAAATERQVKALENTLNRLGDPDRASVGGPAALDRAQQAGREGAIMRQRFGDDPLAAQREQRRQKELHLANAQDQRKRSLDAMLASARLDVDLIGQTTAQVEARRLAFQLEQQVREEAARNNIKVDGDEIARIHEMAGEYGRLRALQQAQSTIRSQQDDLEIQRAELGLVGQNALAHDRAIAALKAEQEIRKLGIPLYGDEANAMRANTAALSDLAAASSRAQLRDDLALERRQLGRTDLEQTVAGKLKQYGLPEDLDSQDAALIRSNELLKQQVDLWKDIRQSGMDAYSDIFDLAFDGFDNWKERLSDIAKDMAKNLFNLGIKNPFLDAIYPSEEGDETAGIATILATLLPGEQE